MEAASRYNTRRLVWTALLSALAAVLMYLDTALPIFPSFLKLDLSDLPALIAAFTYGPAAGVFTELIKNLIHMFTTSSAGIGELANFIMGSALIIPAGLIYRSNRTRRGAVIGLTVGTISMATTAAFANYFILLPIYSHLMPIERIIELTAAVIPAVYDKFTLIIYAIIPFNLLKGTLVSIVTIWLYKRIITLLCG